MAESHYETTPVLDETKEFAPVVDLSVIVGRNLRKLRTRRGHSLERLAKLSGVSRAMLGQIETGKSVPTINLLWKVAAALDVPLTTLVGSTEGRGPCVLRKDSGKRLISSDGGFIMRSLAPMDTGRNVEFYDVRIASDHRERADPYQPGTQINLVVSDGRIEISIGREPPLMLETGDAILFDADQPHSYRAVGPYDASAYLVLIETGTSATL